MNRTRVRIAVLALPFVALGVGLGCLGEPGRTYFDDLLDGSADGTVMMVVDSSTPDSSTIDAGGDDGLAGDANADVLDAGLDAPVETGCGPTNTLLNCGACGAVCDNTHSSPTECTGGSCQYAGCDAGWGNCNTAPPDTNGCETPLNTATNCTGCGIACDTTHSNDASCSGTTCEYASCAAGWSDCKNAPPNADGCECHAPGCCGDGGTVCEPLHDNGIGNTFYDCTPVGTYSAALALKACTAYTDAASQCVSYPCKPLDAGSIICSSGNPTLLCMCWSYAGASIGQVDNGGLPPGVNAQNCFCPQNDPPWN